MLCLFISVYSIVAHRFKLRKKQKKKIKSKIKKQKLVQKKNRRMKQIKWTYKKYFLFKETTTTTKKQKKCQKIEVNGVEKMKFKMYIGPLLPKWQLKPSFQQRLFWPPYRSNRTLRAYWMSNCPQNSPIVTEGRKFSVRLPFGQLS